jgi:hypothetical protein
MVLPVQYEQAGVFPSSVPAGIAEEGGMLVAMKRPRIEITEAGIDGKIIVEAAQHNARRRRCEATVASAE